MLRLAIPKMPRAASTFANDLQVKIRPMISRVSGGYKNVPELVACYCAVINHLTKDYAPVLTLLQACDGESSDSYQADDQRIYVQSVRV